MRFLLVFIFVTQTLVSNAQNIETVSKSTYEFNNGKQKYFSFIENGIDTADLNYIATYKATVDNKKSEIANCFFTIKQMANQIGANCFRLKSFLTDSSGVQSFILDVFYAPDTVINANLGKHPKNVVYIFCSEKISNNIYSLKVDNQKTEFKSGTYLVYELKEGQEIKFNKGGFTGATVWTKYQINRIATFFTITGFGLGGALPPPGTIGVSFNTGRINYIDKDLGFMLTKLLSRAN